MDSRRREVHADRAHLGGPCERLEPPGSRTPASSSSTGLGGQRLGDRAADAAVGAGDEGGGAGEIHARLRPSARDQPSVDSPSGISFRRISFRRIPSGGSFRRFPPGSIRGLIGRRLRRSLGRLRTATVAVLGLRVAYGAGLIAAPARLARRWLGPAAGTPPAQVPLRGLGAREIVLHGGALAAALRERRCARGWPRSSQVTSPTSPRPSPGVAGCPPAPRRPRRRRRRIGVADRRARRAVER